MFSLIKACIKAGISIGLTLILSHMIEWNGKTISDHVGSFVSYTQESRFYQAAKDQTLQWIQYAGNFISSQEEQTFQDRRAHQDQPTQRDTIRTKASAVDRIEENITIREQRALKKMIQSAGKKEF
jgi:hypothetical protein